MSDTRQNGAILIKSVGDQLSIVYKFIAQGSDSGPFCTGCVNTISKEMGPFSASSEWNEWIDFHSKWVSYQHGHFNMGTFCINFPFNMGHIFPIQYGSSSTQI